MTGILTACTIIAKLNPELCSFRITEFLLEINPLFSIFSLSLIVAVDVFYCCIL